MRSRFYRLTGGQRRRKRGLPVAPAGKVLPFLLAWSNNDPAGGAALDAAAEVVLQDDTPVHELRAARLLLAEWRMAEALLAHAPGVRHLWVSVHSECAVCVTALLDGQ
jgi:hypothetical protein